MPTPVHLFDLDLDSLRLLVTEWGMSEYRAEQVLDWVYSKGVANPEQMSNLSKHDRHVLSRRLCFNRGRVVAHERASDGVQKLLVDWSNPGASLTEQPPQAPPGQGGGLAAASAPSTTSDRALQTECVLIPNEKRRTACISSQIGCPVGCRFCASGVGGLDGNLSAGQIVEQVWHIDQLRACEKMGTRSDTNSRGDTETSHAKVPVPTFSQALANSEDETKEDRRDQTVTNVVFMGMGEPLANFSSVVAAVRTLTSPWGLDLSARRITISTVGLPTQIRRLADTGLPVTLAISLHAPDDALRRELIPWAQFVSLSQLIESGQYFFSCTGREVTLEYILLRQVNDRPEHAQKLARLAKRLRSNVNLIRYNEVNGIPYDRPASEDVYRFQTILRSAGINTHIRASRGRDIAAACGQLKGKRRSNEG